jgi:hypothetical protein
MSKKKKTSSPAELLIESLMDDLKDIQAEVSFHNAKKSQNFDFDIDADYGSNSVIFDPNAQNPDEDVLQVSKKQIITAETKKLLRDFKIADLDRLNSNEPAPQIPDHPKKKAEKNNITLQSDLKQEQGPDLNTDSDSESDLKSIDLANPTFEEKKENGPKGLMPVLFYTPDDDDSTQAIASNPKLEYKEEKLEFNIADKISRRKIPAASENNSIINLGTHSNTSTNDKTQPVEGFANIQAARVEKNKDFNSKVSVVNFRGNMRSGGVNLLTSVDASLAQAESLKLAQFRILELEKEVETLRMENEELGSAGEIIRSRAEIFASQVGVIEKEKNEIKESAKNELMILKGSLRYKEEEAIKARVKIDELETRLKSDFKKIRVRERELENRLELLRAEKVALVRSKDDYILDQKRKIEQISQELDNYRNKCLELNKALEANQDQFKRTERALRLALTNLEVKEESLMPIKKAE